MELREISREIIKPSSPTPPHLRTYKLSLLDQIIPDIYVPIILFYSGKSKDTNVNNTSNHLKNSLSETLIHYYPFAGRVQNAFSVDCDDCGVTFIEACVAKEMSEVLNQPEMDLLEQLLPCKPLEKPNTQLVLVQVNYFGCGGMAICACFNHVIADATSAANFIKNWAAIACGSSDVKNVIFDCTSIFPPQDVSSLKSSIQRGICLSLETVAKRFTFGGDKIAALREKIGNIGPGVDRPTRFEAVSVLILGAVIAMARERDELLEAIIGVNLRKRLNPQLPPQCIGNIIQGILMNVHCSREKTDFDYKSLAGKLHESIKMMNDNSIRMVHADGGFMNSLRNAFEGVSENDIRIRKLYLTSWCRLPYYEADFGWERPIWATTAWRLDDTVVLFDTYDGEGIEAWVALSKEDMAKFEQDSAIISYASFNTAVI